MSEAVKCVHYDHPAEGTPCRNPFTVEGARQAQRFHQSFPEYRETPLVRLDALAGELGVVGILLKDESQRFGLNAFKVLGGSYCIAVYIAKRLGLDIRDLPYERLVSREIKEKLGPVTFITATDGNHGRGIAWTAQKLQQTCVVYMPKGSARERLENIRALGAQASITDLNYDGAVALAKKHAEERGWVLVQDTTKPDYLEIPGWIMQGYTTMGAEIMEQLRGQRPTHIFLQAGVGAMAGAMAGFFAHLFPGEEKPVITIVEPNKADCVYRTAEAADGTLHTVTDDMNTIMAGLACGEPCSIGWEVLRGVADNFVSVPEYVAAQGMRVLAAPAGGDQRVVSGESGAATMGLVTEVMRDPCLAWLKEQLGLDEHAVILCISTEGDTDKENYRRIVWDGAYQKE